MAFSYNVDTYAKARKAAEQAYGIIPQVNASLASKLPKDREEAIEYLTDQIWPVVQKEYPKDKFDEKMAAELASSKDDDWFKMWYLGDSKYSPRVQAKQEQFNKFQDLVVDGKWYNMPNKELDLKMSELGYDPTNKDSRKEFFDVLGQHDVNYNRAKAVQETMDDSKWYNKLGYLAYPSVYSEAMRQSLTGDFDDSKVYGALGVDFLTGAGMAAAPYSKVIAANPVAAGLVDASLETGRQVANIASGREADPLAIFGAGMGAATVPMLGIGVQGDAGRGGALEAKPLARGMARGLRGADDPVTAERNALKQLLVAARNQSKAARDNLGLNMQAVRQGVKGNKATLLTTSQVENAKAWKDAAEKLNILGLKGLDGKAPPVGITNVNKVTDVIGEFPSGTKYSTPIDPTITADQIIQKVYDKPSMYKVKGWLETATPKQYDEVSAALGNMKQAFPAKYERDLAMGASNKNKAAYNLGLLGGKSLGFIGTRVEPNIKVNPLQISEYDQKLKRFRETEWFKNLPKDKKNAIEKALKGEE